VVCNVLAALATPPSRAVTLLNPHFYLDTVILLGGVSSQFHGDNRLYFWAGAVSAATLWFISLSLGGQMLAPLFKNVLFVSIGCVYLFSPEW